MNRWGPAVLAVLAIICSFWSIYLSAVAHGRSHCIEPGAEPGTCAHFDWQGKP